MARFFYLVSTTEGTHHILVGLNNNELSSFKWQLYIEKHGPRMIDWAQAMSLNFVTFMGGNLWVHNSDTAPRANLFGEQKDVKVGVVINEQVNTIKLLDSLGVHSDGQWSVESIIVPPTLNRKAGMSSRIPKERFKKREGVWKAEFLRNLKSTSDSESISDAIKGEPLKGHYAYMILKNENNPDGEQVKLYKVDVNLTTIRG